MQGITIDELAAIIGGKEIELYTVRRELARTRQVLEEVTRGDAQERGDDDTSNDAEADYSAQPSDGA